MLPGQPVSLLGPRRDEHGPGVGVNTLGQHLLGQENKGNQQSPEQEQRAGPQIHQSIGVPLPGAQGSRQRQIRRPPRVSALRPRSALPAPAQPDRPWGRSCGSGRGAAGTAAQPAGRWRAVRSGRDAALLAPWAGLGAPLAARDAGPCWPQGCPRSSAAASPSAELLFTSPVAQCVLMLCAHKHGRQTGRGAGRGRRRGNGGCASCCWSLLQTGAPSPTQRGGSGHGALSNREGSPACPVPWGARGDAPGCGSCPWEGSAGSELHPAVPGAELWAVSRDQARTG